MSDEEEDEEEPTTVDENKSKSRRQSKPACKCGSKTHKRTTSLKCPLNPQYKAVDETYLGWRGSGRGTDRAKVLRVLQSRNIDPETVVLDRSSQDTDATVDETKGTIPTTTTPTFEPAIGDNVFAKYKPRKWYLAQLTDIDRRSGLHTCYFVDDGHVKFNMTIEDIRPVTNCSWPTRDEMLNKQWYFDGAPDISPSRWVVRRCVDNKFFCVRIGNCPKGELNAEHFDIGYVTTQYMEEQQRIRNRF